MDDVKLDDGVEILGFIDQQMLAAKFHKSVDTIDRWMREAGLSFRKIGNRRFYRIVDLERWMEQGLPRSDGRRVGLR